MTDQALRARREKIVREHMADEIDHAWDKVLATFPHPHYEIIATGAVHDGRPDVERYYTTSRTTFPDQRNTLLSLRHVDDGSWWSSSSKERNWARWVRFPPPADRSAAR